MNISKILKRAKRKTIKHKYKKTVYLYLFMKSEKKRNKGSEISFKKKLKATPTDNASQ